MSPAGESHQRVILRQAARRLIAAARSERALIPENSPERRFYLGVEAAAEEILHPELAATRSTSWLARQGHSFRDGYLQTSTMLSSAMTSDRPPYQLRLPSFQPIA